MQLSLVQILAIRLFGAKPLFVTWGECSLELYVFKQYTTLTHTVIKEKSRGVDSVHITLTVASQ